MDFKLVSHYQPTGDQPEAIARLIDGVLQGDRAQTLMGVTGLGQNVHDGERHRCFEPSHAVLAHNKTLAAQLCTEFKEFFPENAVEYFVSYYDYYQPEAYIPSTDTYIEKDSAINDEIDRLRHSATAAPVGAARRPSSWPASRASIRWATPSTTAAWSSACAPGMQMSRDELTGRLVNLQYERNDVNFVRNKFRVRGDIVEIHLAYADNVAIRVEFFGDEIDRISEVNPLTGERIAQVRHVAIFPASHYIVSGEKMRAGLARIRTELDAQVETFRKEGKLLEAQRIAQRTNYDIEMLQEVGTCKGIENYSAVLSGRAPGSTPTTLLDYFPDDFLLFVDESHVMLPQLRAMYGGDYARKKSLVDYGFRLPSAFDNRPLKFEEFDAKLNQMVFVSATPGEYEREHSSQIVEQVIRPTGLLDPRVVVKPVEGQDRGSAGRDQHAHGARRARAGDDADEEDGRGFDRLSQRARCESEVHAPRSGHVRARGADARSAQRRHRRDRGYQPAARGAGPAGGVACCHPRRRPRGLSAQRDSLIQTIGPRGAQRGRLRHHVRRHRHALDGARHLRDRAPPRHPDGL